MPFANAYELSIHFTKHGAKFGVTTEVEYQQMADEFLFGPIGRDTSECIRPSGDDRLRCEMVLRHFGVASVTPVFVKTFYPVNASVIFKHGGCAGFFRYECVRIDL